MKNQFLFYLAIITSSINASGQSVSIKGQILNTTIDSIKVAFLGDGMDKKSVKNSIALINGKFNCNYKIAGPTYFYITDEINYIGGLIEQNDNITIDFNTDDVKNTLKIGGKGSEKVRLSYKINKLNLYRLLVSKTPTALKENYPFDYLFNFVDSIGNNLLAELQSIKSCMLPQSYSLLLGDIKGTIMANKYKSIGLLYHEGINETLVKRKNQLTKSSIQYINNILNFDSSLYHSQNYTSEVFNILFTNYSNLLFLREIEPGITNKYKYLNEHLPSKLRRPVLAKFIGEDLYNLKNSIEIDELSKVIANTYSRNSDSIYKKSFEVRLKNLLSLKNGMIAPDFELENEEGTKVTLASFRGKVIFLDFWYGACGPCHLLFNDLKPLKKLYEKNDDIVFLSVSIDSKETWLKALKKYAIAGQHLFTQNKGMGHPIIQSYNVLGYPTTYIIDAYGKIFSASPSRNIEDLHKEIEQALANKTN